MDCQSNAKPSFFTIFIPLSHELIKFRLKYPNKPDLDQPLMGKDLWPNYFNRCYKHTSLVGEMNAFCIIFKFTWISMYFRFYTYRLMVIRDMCEIVHTGILRVNVTWFGRKKFFWSWTFFFTHCWKRLWVNISWTAL
jgi:hypothetical protein